MKNRWELILTEDGSHSLRDHVYGDKFHSREGSVQESIFVYIESGLIPLISSKDKIKIFEMGFGTGLNVLLTACYAKEFPEKSIDLTSIEFHPLPEAIWSKLNYPEHVKCSDGTALFQSLHSSEWGKYFPVLDNFSVRKLEDDIRSYEFDESYDLVYFDAFGPKYQADLWSIEILRRIYDALNKGGRLITYCAKGQFKRDLKEIGYKVINLPGPPGKREITLGIKE